MLTYRMYLQTQRNGSRTFLCTIRVPSILDALRATDAYAKRRREGQVFFLKLVNR